ncbi:MAG: hypothetical protein HOI95_23595 [Chromatiales bacterium]|jgi:hypothetical protein|nr:hypothetical protein [Chromatiales bacterium]
MAEVTPLFLEHRFPLGLDTVIAPIRALYDESKAAHWDPHADIEWKKFLPAALTDDQREAARLSWSRRAWVEYTAIGETPSLLVRFCVERGREADPKFYLTVRNTEEAWHIECCHLFADLCGGYIEQPTGASYAQSLNRAFHREVLHAETPLDAYVAAHCALTDTVELGLWEGYAANATDQVVRNLLDRCVADKRRHARFGWLYLEARQSGWTGAERKEISQYVDTFIRDVELNGYHCVSLSDGPEAVAIGAADETTAAAGLGALAPQEERRVMHGCLTDAIGRLRSLGIDLPDVDDPRLTQ